MALPTWAVAAGGSLTGFQNAGTVAYRVCIGDAVVSRRHPREDVTQSGDTDTYATPASTAVTPGVFRASKRYTYNISGVGFYQVTADAGTTWTFQHATKAVAGAITGAVQGRVSRCELTRNAELINATATNDAVPETVFAFGKVVYTGSMDGYLQASETPLGDDVNPADPTSITLPMGSGTVAGDIIFDGMDQVLAFNRGGPHRLITPFVLSGDITRTDTPFDIMSWTVAGDLDNGQTLSGTATISRMSMMIDYRLGGVIPVEFQGIISQAALA